MQTDNELDVRTKAVLAAALDLPTFERSVLVTLLISVLDGGAEQEVLEAALQLQPAERWRLIDEVSSTLEVGDFDDDLHPSWGPEIERRLADIDNPNVKWLTWEEVRDRLEHRSG